MSEAIERRKNETIESQRAEVVRLARKYKEAYSTYHRCESNSNGEKLNESEQKLFAAITELDRMERK